MAQKIKRIPNQGVFSACCPNSMSQARTFADLCLNRPVRTNGTKLARKGSPPEKQHYQVEKRKTRC
jgi:hypothetical protein